MIYLQIVIEAIEKKNITQEGKMNKWVEDEQMKRPCQDLKPCQRWTER